MSEPAWINWLDETRIDFTFETPHAPFHNMLRQQKGKYEILDIKGHLHVNGQTPVYENIF